MKLSVIVVTYNSAHLINQCISPIYSHIDDHLEILVWDNASTDGTPSIINQKFPNVKLVESSENMGFSKANNEAFKRSNGDYILLINPDAFIDGYETISQLIKIISVDQSIGALGPQLISSDLTHQVGDAGWDHTLKSAASHFLFLHKIFGIKSLYLTKASLLKRDIVEVDWVCGACMLIRRDVINKIGGLYQGIFMYGEDVEWGRRIISQGWKVLYAPKIKVLHLQGATQKANDQAVYYSTSWLDALFAVTKQRSPIIGIKILKLIAIVGFGMRYILAIISSTSTRASSQKRAAYMARYIRYVWLQSF